MTDKPPRLLWGPDYLALPRPPQTWVVETLLPTGGFLQLFGDPKKGKSFGALQLALSISQAHPDCLGFPIHTSGPVAYLQLDTPSTLWADRVRTLVEDHSLTALALHDKDTCPHVPFDIRNTEHWRWLRDWLLLVNPVAVVIDTYREVFRGDENDSDIGQQVLTLLLAALYPAALILVHHTSRPKEGADHGMYGRGSSYVSGRSDCNIRVSTKQWKIQSRAAEDRVLSLIRTPTGLWALEHTTITAAHMDLIRQDPTLTSDRARARKLSSMTGAPFDRCHYMLRRGV